MLQYFAQGTLTCTQCIPSDIEVQYNFMLFNHHYRVVLNILHVHVGGNVSTCTVYKKYT